MKNDKKYVYHMYGGCVIMFGKKVKNEKPVVVTTKEELKTAIKNKKPCIEVHGEIAKKIKWMTKLNRAASLALLPLLAVVGGPMSAAFAVPAAAASAGITAAEITLAVIAISAGMVIAIIKGYNVEVDVKGIVRLQMKK